MLLWSRLSRGIAWAIAGLLIAIIFLAPLLLIAVASITGQWNGVLPSHLTLAHYGELAHGSLLSQIRVSILTGAAASAAALVLGSAAALALRDVPRFTRRALDLAFFMPSAVPSVSVGLGLLVAFSQPPALLSGTTAIVIIAHLVLVSAFAYGNLSAGLMQLPAEYEQIAASLGARPLYRLRRITLPLLTPHLLAALSLSFALSMGELGATAMVYPPGWVTMPVGIFALTDRGNVFTGAAMTMVLVAVTLVVLLGISLIPNRAAHR